MSETGGFDAVGDELRTLLRAARRRVRHADVRKALLTAAERTLWTIGLAGAVFALYRTGLALAGTAVSTAWGVYGVSLAIGVLAVALTAVAPAFFRHASWADTAERLDLAVDDHNRIAIALTLAAERHSTLFAQAAIHDGLAALRRFHDQRPWSVRLVVRGRRLAGLAAACVAVHIVALLAFASPKPLLPLPADAAASAEAPGSQPRQPLEPATTETRPPDTRTPTAHHTEAAAHAASRETKASEAPREAAAESPSSGGGAAGRGVGSAQSRRRAGEGAASAAAQASNPRQGRQAQARSAHPGQKTSENPGRSLPSESDNPPVSAGASSAGQASPVTHDWAQREASAEPDQETTSDEPVEDEQRVSTQRGGLQPSLKDRQASPSRDLGMSGPQDGPPGSGRGGPTPPKKSRGTASLVLGVPVPDFVRGRLGPGTVRIVQERVAPSPMSGTPARPADLAPRTLPESVIPRFAVPLELSNVVRDYLIALHSTAAGGTPPAPPQPSESPERGPQR